jgi:hypothetical protein
MHPMRTSKPSQKKPYVPLELRQKDRRPPRRDDRAKQEIVEAGAEPAPEE